jgi:hypothetical protein
METVPFPRVSGQTNNSSSGMVSLVCLVHLVSLVGGTEQLEILDRRNRRDRPDRPASGAQVSCQFLRVAKKVAAWARREIRSF